MSPYLRESSWNNTSTNYCDYVIRLCVISAHNQITYKSSNAAKMVPTQNPFHTSLQVYTSPVAFATWHWKCKAPESAFPLQRRTKGGEPVTAQADGCLASRHRSPECKCMQNAITPCVSFVDAEAADSRMVANIFQRLRERGGGRGRGREQLQASCELLCFMLCPNSGCWACWWHDEERSAELGAREEALPHRQQRPRGISFVQGEFWIWFWRFLCRFFG